MNNMEYTIYNESLVYYALRNKETGGWVNEKPSIAGDEKFFADEESKCIDGKWQLKPSGIESAYFFDKLSLAQDWAKDTNYEIRKVKVRIWLMMLEMMLLKMNQEKRVKVINQRTKLCML